MILRKGCQLSENNWEYLAGLIIKGDESVAYLRQEYKDSVNLSINKFSPENAKRINTIYELSSCGMI